MGAGVLASAICIDKLTFKWLLAFHSVPQVAFCAVGEEGGAKWRPASAAAVGEAVETRLQRWISKVTALERELDEAIDAAKRHDPRVIVEVSASGKEVECSVIGNDEPEVSVPGEIVAHADWYDYEAKYSDGGMDLLVPADVDDATREQVWELAARVYRIVGCAGLARCDFFVTEDSEVLVNELNTIPGFTETSVFGKLFEASGIAYPELCDRSSSSPSSATGANASSSSAARPLVRGICIPRYEMTLTSLISTRNRDVVVGGLGELVIHSR